MRREKSIWYSASSSEVSFITVHRDLVAHYLNKERKRTVGLFRSSFIRHPYNKRIDKNYIFIARYEHFTNDREIDVEVADGLIHAEEVGNKHFEVLFLELVEDKKSFF